MATLEKDPHCEYLYHVVHEDKVLGKIHRIGPLSSTDYRFEGLTLEELEAIVEAMKEKVCPFGPSPVYFRCGCIEPRAKAGAKCSQHNEPRIVY